MKRFPKKCRQRRSSGDLLFICVKENDKKSYSHRYFGLWEDPNSHEEYERQKKLFEISSGDFLFPTKKYLDFTNYDLADQFMTWARSYYQKNGKQTKEPINIFESIRYVVDFYGSELASEFNLKKLRAIQSYLDGSGRLCRRMVNRRINHIRRLFRWGAENELVPLEVVMSLSLLSPLKRGRCHASDRKEVTSVPLDVVDATLPFLTTVIADMVRLQLLTGARPEEIRIMRPVDIQRDAPEMWHYTPSHDKTQHMRSSKDKKIIPLGRQAISIILDHTIGISDDSKEFVFRPIDSYAEHCRTKRSLRKTPMTPSQLKRGKRVKKDPKRKFNPFFTASAYRQAIRRASRAAGVKDWFPYQLRHTSATEVEKIFGWRAAQVHLGHKSPDTTKIYIDKNLELADRIAREIG